MTQTTPQLELSPIRSSLTSSYESIWVCPNRASFSMTSDANRTGTIFTMPAASFNSPKRILVCDDERHIVRLIQVNLERQGHTLTCTFSAREAVQELDRAGSTCEVAFLDGCLAPPGSYEILKRIRTGTHVTPCWVCVTLDSAADLAWWEAQPHQADLYVVKPSSLLP